jgi:hypothetical protein
MYERAGKNSGLVGTSAVALKMELTTPPRTVTFEAG